MISQIQKITSLLMVLGLLTPSIVKLEHEHDDFVCKATTEKHLHTYHEKCDVCNFEFSLFSEAHPYQPITKSEFDSNYYSPFNQAFVGSNFIYSFRLRGPPAGTNSI